jgi:hypothetical protein
MKNILGTQEDLTLYNKAGNKVYDFRIDLDSYSWEKTYDENGNILTYKNSKGTQRGFDKSQSTQTERKLFPREMLVWDDDELILFKEVVIRYVQNKEFPWIVGSIKKGSDKYFGYKNAKEI